MADFQMQEITFALAANEVFQYQFEYPYVKIESALYDAKIGLDSSTLIEAKSGRGFLNDQTSFRRLRLVNGDTPQSITMLFASREVADTRVFGQLEVALNGGTASVTVTDGQIDIGEQLGLTLFNSTDISVPPNTLTALYTGVSQTVYVQNLSAGQIRVGGANIGANTGLILAAGGTVEIPGRQGVYVWHDQTGNADVARARTAYA